MNICAIDKMQFKRKSNDSQLQETLKVCNKDKDKIEATWKRVKPILLKYRRFQTFYDTKITPQKVSSK